MTMVCKLSPKKSPGSQSETGTGGSPENEFSADYETALDLAGYGRFSRSALGACASAFFTTGVQNCLMAYVLPAARCELGLSTYHAGLINMSFMCGGVASAFFWGIVADVFGRRRVLSCTLLFDGLLTVAQSTVNDYRILVLVRFINGFLIGGPSTLVLSYLSDLVGVRKRQLYLNVTGMGFVIAWLIIPAMAWLILPYKPSQYSPTIFPIYSWRLFLAVSSVPGLVSGIWVLFLPESPRLLADTNRGDEAVKILARIYEANVRKTNEQFKIKSLTMTDTVLRKNISEENSSRSKELFLGVIKDLKMFVSKAYAFKSSLILFMFFANMAAGFGLNLWIPELFLRMQARGCDEVIASNLSKPLIQNITPVNWHEYSKVARLPVYKYHTRLRTLENNFTHHDINVNVDCSDNIHDEIYTSGLIVGACCVLGNAACAILSSRGGMKGVRLAAAGCALACATACACLAACACGCTAPKTASVAAAAALNAASLNGNVLLIRLLLYAVPAKMSGLAVCWGAWWGRAGGVASNFAVGALLDLSCPAPFASVAAFLVVSVGAIMMIKLDPTDKATKETGVTETHTIEKNSGLDKYITTHM